MSAMYELMDDVAVVRLNQPPMNGLSLSTRQDVMQSLERSAADPQVKAVILIGSEKAFSSGADISEFGSMRAYQEPNLLTLVDAVVGCGDGRRA
jgi:3-hydroxyacyl-CoA dehydrogenase